MYVNPLEKAYLNIIDALLTRVRKDQNEFVVRKNGENKYYSIRNPSKQ